MRIIEWGFLKEVIYCKEYVAEKLKLLEIHYITNQEYSNADHF